MLTAVYPADRRLGALHRARYVPLLPAMSNQGRNQLFRGGFGGWIVGWHDAQLGKWNTNYTNSHTGKYKKSVAGLVLVMHSRILPGMTILQENLKSILETGTLSISKLAQLTGLNQPTLYRILKDTSKEPRTSTIEPIARFMGVSVDQLRTQDLSGYLSSLKDQLELSSVGNARHLEIPNSVPPPKGALSQVGSTLPDSSNSVAPLTYFENHLVQMKERRENAGLGALNHLINWSPLPGGIAEALRRTPAQSDTNEFAKAARVNQLAWSSVPERMEFQELLEQTVPRSRFDATLPVGVARKRLDYLSDKLAVGFVAYRSTPPSLRRQETLVEEPINFHALPLRLSQRLFSLALVKKTHPDLQVVLLVLTEQMPSESDKGRKQVEWEADQFGVNVLFATKVAEAVRMISTIEEILPGDNAEDDSFGDTFID